MQVWVNWNNSTAAFLCDAVLQFERCSDLAGRLDQHRPGQVGDFTGAQASLDRQQHQHLVADGMSGLAHEDQQVFDMVGRQDFGALANHLISIIALLIDCRPTDAASGQQSKTGITFFVHLLIRGVAILPRPHFMPEKFGRMTGVFNGFDH